MLDPYSDVPGGRIFELLVLIAIVIFVVKKIVGALFSPSHKRRAVQERAQDKQEMVCGDRSSNKGRIGKYLGYALKMFFFMLTSSIIISVARPYLGMPTKKERLDAAVESTMNHLVKEGTITPFHVYINEPNAEFVDIRFEATSSYRRTQFWGSSSLEAGSYCAYTTTASGKNSATFVVNLKNCKNMQFFIFIDTPERLINIKDADGNLNFKDILIPLKYSSRKLKDDSLIVFVSSVAEPPIDLMKKENFMEVYLDRLNITSLFSLKGFTASYNRMYNLCK